MEKKNVTTFYDYGDYIYVNNTPYYPTNSVSKIFLRGIFLGMTLGLAVACVAYVLIK